MTADHGNAILLLVGLLLTKHFVCDFLLQTPYQIRNKGTYGHPGGLLHAALHSSATGVVLWLFLFGPAFILVVMATEFVVHYHVDWAKEQIVRRLPDREGSGFWALFGFDQLLHHLTYVVIAANG